MATTTDSEQKLNETVESKSTSFSWFSLQTISKVQPFIQPLSPIFSKVTEVAGQYYENLKTQSPFLKQSLEVVETIFFKTKTQVNNSLNSKLNEKAKEQIEKLDEFGVSLVQKVETGRKRSEKVLLRPALFVLSLLNHVYLFLRSQEGGSQKANNNNNNSNNTQEVDAPEKQQEFGGGEDQEGKNLTEVCKEIGQKTWALGPHVVSISKKIFEVVRSQLGKSSLFVELEKKVRELLHISPSSKRFVEDVEEIKTEEKKER